ncbi:MAG: hypothetical protein ACRDE6_07540 [Candidatus Limnocylindria bacterium]
MTRLLLTVTILMLGMGAAVAVSWFAFGRVDSYSLEPAAMLTPSRLLVYGSQFLLVGALLFWQARGQLRGVSPAMLAVLVTAAWLGEGAVLTVIGEPLVANELDPEIAWYFWLVATAGPLQPAAAFIGGLLGQRRA